ncbi:MAG: hypothetical protein AB9846_08540 [Tenuifilaceae bacterium]
MAPKYKTALECLFKDFPNQTICMMTDVDAYYKMVDYKSIGSILEVPKMLLG